MVTSIEEFLDLDEATRQSRMEELRQKIPTRPGIGYLEERLKVFQVEPWPLVIYLAYHNPRLLEETLDHYSEYAGAEAYQAIREQLREYHIIGMVLEELTRNQELVRGAIPVAFSRESK